MRQSKKISVNDNILPGWKLGRKIDFSYLDDTTKDEKAIAKAIALKNKIARLSAWYEIYKEVGFNKFVEITNYKYTKQNLVATFSTNLPHFIPQNGKKRGK